MAEKPILFYSKTCKNCQALWKKLVGDSKLESFIKICVDGNPKIPSFVTHVPTIYVKGRPLIVGPGIGMFLNSVPAVSKPSPSSGSSNNLTGAGARVSNIPNQTQEVVDGISAYLPTEMGGTWSDSYSYLDSSDPLKHSFEFINNSPGVATGIAPGAPSPHGRPPNGSAGIVGGGGRQPVGGRKTGGETARRYEELMTSRR
jgi:hypothetical protein